MAFFLLGKSPDDRLTLLSDVAFPTRQEAMSELSRVTATPEFSAWDAEVMVVDSDLGTPVLLVRPSAAAAQNPPEVPPTHETSAGEPSDEPDPALTAVLLDLGIDAAQPADETADENMAEDTFVAESESPAEVVDAAWADAVSDSGETADQGLKSALERTAAQMEAQGISAPESVGPAAAPADAAPESAAAAPEEDTSSDDSVVPSDAEEPNDTKETATENANDGVGSAQGPADEPDEPEAEPAPETGLGVEADELPDAEAPVAAWPWDTLTSAELPASAADESGPDDESMIRALADDDASRTVVLGEYAVDDLPSDDALTDSNAAEPEPIVAADAPEPPVDVDPTLPAAGSELPVDKLPTTPDESEAKPVEETPVSDAEPAAHAPEPAVDLEPDGASEAASDRAASDFVDLGEVAPAPISTAYEPGDPDMDGMTCDDCVYVETCPNKDEREPKTCGSFQWK